MRHELPFLKNHYGFFVDCLKPLNGSIYIIFILNNISPKVIAHIHTIKFRKPQISLHTFPEAVRRHVPDYPRRLAHSENRSVPLRNHMPPDVGNAIIAPNTP